MSWTVIDPGRPHVRATCCYCGRRAPGEAGLMRAAGWQMRMDYPVRYRCPRCRRRHEPEAAA